MWSKQDENWRFTPAYLLLTTSARWRTVEMSRSSAGDIHFYRPLSRRAYL
ncbi:hypothetical protein KCP70_10195 [Salmonella enterica subsp. enterica]|nr:hypothetical protein KCP70_10195 [Salmonella enterica subsp. enterica]